LLNTTNYLVLYKRMMMMIMFLGAVSVQDLQVFWQCRIRVLWVIAIALHQECKQRLQPRKQEGSLGCLKGWVFWLVNPGIECWMMMNAHRSPRDGGGRFSCWFEPWMHNGRLVPQKLWLAGMPVSHSRSSSLLPTCPASPRIL